MKLGIIGSRTFTDYEFMKRHVDLSNVELIVSGGARGADSLAEQLATEHNIPTLIFKADWKTHGVAAGFIRNTTIVEESDVIIAFWDGKSRGTMDTVSKAKKAGKTVSVIQYTQGTLDF
jgi:YspA, cpYpsA-related SLOG family